MTLVDFIPYRRETAYDMLKAIMKRGGGNYKEEAEKALIGCIVITAYNNMSYRIDELVSIMLANN